MTLLLDTSTTIKLGRLYTRKAFQPTNDELNPNDQGMDEDLDFHWEMKGSSQREQDDGDDLKDFIGELLILFPRPPSLIFG